MAFLGMRVEGFFLGGLLGMRNFVGYVESCLSGRYDASFVEGGKG